LARAKNILFNIGEKFHIWNKNGSLHPHRLEFISKLYKKQFIGSLSWVISSMTHRSWDRFVFHLKDKNLKFTRKGKISLPIEPLEFIKKRANSPSGIKRRGAIRSRTRPGGSEERVLGLAVRPDLDEKSSSQLPVIQKITGPQRPVLNRNQTLPDKVLPVGFREGASIVPEVMPPQNLTVASPQASISTRDVLFERRRALHQNELFEMHNAFIKSQGVTLADGVLPQADFSKPLTEGWLGAAKPFADTTDHGVPQKLPLWWTIRKERNRAGDVEVFTEQAINSWFKTREFRVAGIDRYQNNFPDREAPKL
jgi:hypothetical protein